MSRRLESRNVQIDDGGAEKLDAQAERTALVGIVLDRRPVMVGNMTGVMTGMMTGVDDGPDSDRAQLDEFAGEQVPRHITDGNKRTQYEAGGQQGR